MARYIDVDKLKKDLKESPEQERIEYMGIYDVINSQPTADVQEVKHGKWLYENYECSLCGESLRSIMDSDSYFSGDFKGCNYCPNCGAEMKGA